VEIGVGTGRFASALGVPLGVEPSESMRRIARKRGIEVISGKAEALPFRDGCLDYVLMVTVCLLFRRCAESLPGGLPGVEVRRGAGGGVHRP
jgi:ubiquinone/menaquinone biosynthesis C-methylase UbiE